MREALQKIRIEGRFLEVQKCSTETFARNRYRHRQVPETGQRRTLPYRQATAGRSAGLSLCDRPHRCHPEQIRKIKDNASPELAKIRKELLAKQSLFQSAFRLS
jgi:hypothetical protein